MTRSLKINSETQFPQSIHTWDIGKKENKIIVKSRSNASGSGYYEFPFKEGTLYLHNSSCNKYAYFRTLEFQEFLKKNELTGIKKTDPNTVYDGHNRDGGHGFCSFSIKTDGDIISERIGGDFDHLDPNEIGNRCYSSRYRIEVKNATFAIISSVNNYRDNRSSATMLHTLVRDVTKFDLTNIKSVA
ncbi:MAG: hypothetical protein ACFFCW_41450 [Candidatus Hodarchaeota archaeon]